MTLHGLRVLCCALGLLVMLPSSGSGNDRDDAVGVKLRVQNALKRGREMLAAQQNEEAIHVLESELENINGNREYLTTLRDAYWNYIQQLKLAKHDAEAQVYQRRLKVLDPGSVLDSPTPSQPPRPAASVTDSKPVPLVKSPDQPATQAPAPATDGALRLKQARALVVQAQAEFDTRQYEAARQHFEQASQLDKSALADSQERWGYCKLFRVVEQLKAPAAELAPFTQLEKEVHEAMSFAPTPQLEKFGKQLLDRIEDRRTQKGSGTADHINSPAQQTAVQHRTDTLGGWQVAETTHFRIFHHQQHDLSEKVARTAEQTRVDMQRKWFDSYQEWTLRCDIYLHTNAESYSTATKVPQTLPGHSRISIDPVKHVTERQVHLRCDDLHMLTATLPHEVTHTVLGGQFGDKQIPRWADEGMAVLSEPRARVELHLRNLPMHRSQSELFIFRDLVRMDDYPDVQSIGAFYAESVSLVDFLTKKQQPRVFTQFLREGMSKGYEAAVKKYYGYNSLDELQKEWITAVFGGKVAAGEK